MKTLTVKQIGYEITGMAAINLLGGGSGTIPMYPTRLTQEKEPTAQQIQEAVNDGGFGCESILGALVRVDTLYECGAVEYGETQLINLCPVATHLLGKVLSWGHEQASVSVWELDDDQLIQLGLAYFPVTA